tara:strand:+ start:5663 stop:5944 length:282 start_codon:yes stop_codon:yes gene_type:complete
MKFEDLPEPQKSCLDTFEGILAPTRTDNLRPEVLPFIGETLTFRPSFTMLDDEEPYPGQRVYTVIDPDGGPHSIPKGWFGGWIPEEDIKRILP